MITTTYEFVCPLCHAVQTDPDKTRLRFITISASQADTRLVCPECLHRPDFKLEALSVTQIIVHTTLKCDCGGCNNTATFTDKPIACGFPPGTFWAKAEVLPKRDRPGLRRTVTRDICPECVQKALAGTTT